MAWQVCSSFGFFDARLAGEEDDGREPGVVKTSALGLSEPLPLTMTRSCTRPAIFQPQIAGIWHGPGPGLTGPAPNPLARATAITASAVRAREQVLMGRRALPNDDTARPPWQLSRPRASPCSRK